MVTRIIERVAGKPKKHHYQKVSITALFFSTLKRMEEKPKKEANKRMEERYMSKNEYGCNEDRPGLTRFLKTI